MFKTIKGKLIGSFGLLTVLITALSLFNASKIGESADGFKEYRAIAKNSVLAARIQANMLEMRIGVLKYLDSESDEALQEFEKRYSKTLEYVQLAKKQIVKPHRAKEVDVIDDELSKYKSGVDEIKSLMGQRREIIESNLDKNGPIMTRLIAEVVNEVKDQGPEAVAVGTKTLSNLLAARLATAKVIQHNKKENVDQAEAEFKKMGNHLDDFIPYLKTQKTRQDIEQLHQLATEYQQGIHQLLEIVEKRNDILNNQLNKIGAHISAVSENIKLETKKEQDTTGSYIQDLDESLITMTLLVSGLIALISIIIATLIPRSVSRGLHSIESRLAEITKTGDFSIRADDSRQDEIGEMAHFVNDMLANTQTAITEANHVVQAIAKGNFAQRVQADYKGDLAVLKEGVNASAESVAFTMSELKKVMEGLYEGDFSVRMDNRVEAAFREMVDKSMNAMNGVTSDISRVMAAMNEGQFDHQVEAEARGELLQMKNAINDSMMRLKHAMDIIAKVVLAQAEGDLTQSCQGDFRGDLKTLSDAMNQSVAKLSGIVGQAVQAAGIVSTAASEVSQGATDLSQRVQEQAAALEETSATMDEMNSAVQANTEN
ncbi:MAG: HAMP domain-containing protein, partial [Thiotrichales bacterium]|nr:HAMP domain-containing protein [Thiotrichales bacterium]